jgi:hypothetical protein
MSSDSFRLQFEQALETGAEALESAGYDVNGYSASIAHSRGNSYRSHQEDPLEALDTTLKQARKEDESLFTHLNSREIAEAIHGDLDVESLIYRNIRGGIDIEDPEVQPEWADNPQPAYGTSIQYIPEQDDYFEIGTAETQPPHTTEDAEERVEDIIETLESTGLTAEKGFIE